MMTRLTVLERSTHKGSLQRKYVKVKKAAKISSIDLSDAFVLELLPDALVPRGGGPLRRPLLLRVVILPAHELRACG